MAQARPGHPALVCGERTWTYADLWSQSAATARALLFDGLQQGEPVGLIGENEAAYVCAYIAILRAGGVAVPVNAMLDAKSVREQLALVGATVVFVGKVASDVRQALEGDHIIHQLGYATGLVGSRRLPAVIPKANCSIMLTSGSTGRPKGVVHSHRSMLHGCLQLASTFPFGPAERGVVFLPLYACIPEQVLPTLCTGGTLEILPGFDVDRVAEACTRATTLDAVPTVLRRLIEHAPHDKLSSLKWVLFASEVMPVNLLRRWWDELPGIEMHQFYGMTEALPLAGAPHALLRAEPSTVGRPFPTTGMRVLVDSSHSDGSGEIIASTPARMTGYFNDRIATKSAYTDSGELRTGDVGRIDDRGLVFLTGRRKDIIISGGINISPGEIEAVAGTHPGVQEAVVVGIPSDRWGETPVVVAVARPNQALSAHELVRHCRTHLSSFKKPSAAALVPQLPTTGIGKADKATVRKMIADGVIDLVFN
ncbi:class I adenylate-forming enzyme family protein [Nocardioides aurantiacus]|uniref:class I adenylate-forming enzyme family protein n=1 Tax=Nocardioides aurantiacus TaxID=86796 RepID=UPI00403F932F